MTRSWAEVQSIILEKASRDEEYRRRLLENPVRVAQEESGGTFPEPGRIKVIEADPETGYILLPPRSSAAGELSDSALDAVSGGGSSYFSSDPLPRGGWDGNHIETMRRPLRR